MLGALAQERKIAAIDFFGHQGLDVSAEREALPFEEGAVAPKGFGRWKASVRKAVLSATGRESTDQAFVCCWNGDWVVYAGVHGPSVFDPKLKASPIG